MAFRVVVSLSLYDLGTTYEGIGKISLSPVTCCSYFGLSLLTCRSFVRPIPPCLSLTFPHLQAVALELLGAKEEELDDIKQTIHEVKGIYRDELEKMIGMLPSDKRFNSRSEAWTAAEAEGERGKERGRTVTPERQRV